MKLQLTSRMRNAQKLDDLVSVNQFRPTDSFSLLETPFALVLQKISLLKNAWRWLLQGIYSKMATQRCQEDVLKMSAWRWLLEDGYSKVSNRRWPLEAIYSNMAYDEEYFFLAKKSTFFCKKKVTFFCKKKYFFLQKKLTFFVKIK